jgi:hypothetical protein
MATINIAQECGCFKKSDLVNNVSFENKDDAMIKAQSIVKHMNEEFCGKHGFELSENGDDFAIAMRVPQQAQASGGCCGGGHCS